MVTTIPRGDAGGFTMVRPETDDEHVSRGKMYQDIVMGLGGRVAEAITFEDIYTGAYGDIQMVTKRARAMVTKVGFSDQLGPVAYGGSSDEVFLGRDYGHTQNYSEATAAMIDEEIRRIINKAYNECEELLKSHRTQLDDLAEYLLEYEKINGDDFDKLMKGELKWEKKDKKAEDKTDDPETKEEDAKSETEEKTEEKPQDKPEDNKE